MNFICKLSLNNSKEYLEIYGINNNSSFIYRINNSITYNYIKNIRYDNNILCSYIINKNKLIILEEIESDSTDDIIKIILQRDKHILDKIPKYINKLNLPIKYIENINNIIISNKLNIYPY